MIQARWGGLLLRRSCSSLQLLAQMLACQLALTGLAAAQRIERPRIDHLLEGRGRETRGARSVRSVWASSPKRPGRPTRSLRFSWVVSVPAVDEQSFRSQRLGKAFLDLIRLGTRNSLQMKHRPRERLESALQHAAGCTDARLVLVEPLGR